MDHNNQFKLEERGLNMIEDIIIKQTMPADDWWCIVKYDDSHTEEKAVVCFALCEVTYVGGDAACPSNEIRVVLMDDDLPHIGLVHVGDEASPYVIKDTYRGKGNSDYLKCDDEDEEA